MSIFLVAIAPNNSQDQENANGRENSADKILSESLVQKVNALLAAQNIESAPPRWLRPQCAFEIECAVSSREDLPGEIIETLHGEHIDAAFIPSQERRKSLLIADMDSTIIQQECIDEIGDYVGLKDKISKITEQAMRGDLDFEEALQERVALLADIPESALSEILDQKITLMPGAKALIGTMRKNGAFCALVSGGFTFFTSKIAERTGFHTQRANQLAIENGKLTGKVILPILGRQAKYEALNEFTKQNKLALEQTVAIGDGANDLDMIKQAGLGVAYHAKPIVAAQAQAQIRFGDLTALLYMQGYSYSEFAEHQ